MKKYVSWSQFNLYLKDPEEYYRQYVLGIKPEPSMKMVFGSIFSEAYENRGNKKYDLDKRLQQAGFTANYNRIAKNALSQLPYMEDEVCEKTYEIDYTPFNLLGRFDGVIEARNVVIENNNVS